MQNNEDLHCVLRALNCKMLCCILSLNGCCMTVQKHCSVVPLHRFHLNVKRRRNRVQTEIASKCVKIL